MFELIKTLVSLSRKAKIIVMMGTDCVMLALCLPLALALRLGTASHLDQATTVDAVGKLSQSISTVLVPHLLLAYSVGLSLCIVVLFWIVGLYRSVVRFMHFAVLVRCGLALLIGVGAIYWLARTSGAAFPRSSILIYCFVAFSYLVASRFAAVMLLHGGVLLDKGAKRVAIYGAGEAGALVAHALRTNPQYEPVCFFDDVVELKRSEVAGLRVYAASRLEEQIRRREIAQIVIAMPSASHAQRHAVIEQVNRLPQDLRVAVRSLPGMADLVEGRVALQSIREVDLADLLGRDAVLPRADLFAKCIYGRNVLVSGAGGSIGSELCRQILSQHPTKLVLLDSSEYNLYALEQELQSTAEKTGCQLIALLGNAADDRLIQQSIKQHSVETIYHAAAYKHVPLVEANPSTGIANNVRSTWVIARSAALLKVKTCVLVSTDKAVRPTNVMGATKRVAEQIIQAHAQVFPDTIFSMVRFGNVLGSSGSVVPKFLQQINAGGPVTVTHPEITRFFMLIPEAAQLVIQAGAMARGGDVFVLDMGEPVKIAELARQVIRLAGCTEKNVTNQDGDIEIQFTGLRPGEKLYEELLIGDNCEGSEHPKIMRAHESCLPLADLEKGIVDMLKLAENGQTRSAVQVLARLVPEYQTSSKFEDSFALELVTSQPRISDAADLLTPPRIVSF